MIVSGSLLSSICMLKSLVSISLPCIDAISDSKIDASSSQNFMTLVTGCLYTTRSYALHPTFMLNLLHFRNFSSGLHL